jgi:hypothetical protein
MRKLLIVLALAALPLAAAPSYDYIDVTAVQLSYDQDGALPSDDAVGARFRSSQAFDDEWFWTFDLSILDYSTERGTRWGVNLGYAFPLDTVDVAVSMGFGRLDFGTHSGGGLHWDVLVRSATWDRFELNGHIGQRGVEPVDSFITYGVGMVWMPSDGFGVVVEYEMATGDIVGLTGAAVGVRWTF